jgi:hypothetical protein
MSLFIAAHTAFVEFAGKRVKIIKDSTVARAGHAILEGNEHLFKRLHVHYDVEKPKVTPPTPPTPPPAKTVQAKPAAAKAATSEPAEEE